ncbi:MAG: hypothetical protein ACLP8X_37880 [Streptosporangiaceae bacterium]
MLPEEDNMLKVCTDARKAALDLRLLGLPITDPGKIEPAAERVADLWQADCDDTYPAPGGQDAPIRGSLQMVFCDIGTPGDDWNVYDELRDQLAARGLPRESIQFVHDAKSDRDQGELFAACRAVTTEVAHARDDIDRPSRKPTRSPPHGTAPPASRRSLGRRISAVSNG